MKKQLNEKQLTIISALIAAGVLLVLCGGVFYGVSLAGTIRSENETLKERRDDLVRKERALPRLREEIDFLEIDVERMARILPNDQEIASLVKNLDEIACGTSEGDGIIKVTGFQPDEEKRVPGLKKGEEDPDAAFTVYPYIIQAQGNYYHFGKFINLLESHIRFIGTSAFEITIPKDKRLQSFPSRFITIKMVTYTYNRGREDEPGDDEEKRDIPEELLEKSGFEFERKGRRDPFEMALVPLGQGATVHRRRLSLEEQNRLLSTAESLLSQMKNYILTGMTDEALKNYIDIEEIYGKRFTKQEYFVRIGEVYNNAKKEIGTIKEAAAKHAIIRSETAIVRMREFFDKGRYDGVVALDDRVQKELAGMKAFDEGLKDKIESLAAISAHLSNRASIRLELLREGVNVSGFVRLTKPIAVLSSGVCIEEGTEAKLGELTFFVESINVDREEILVLYKGEHITIKSVPLEGYGNLQPSVPESEESPSDEPFESAPPEADNENSGGDSGESPAPSGEESPAGRGGRQA